MSLYTTTIISSPLGDLYAIADEEYLLVLEFLDSQELGKKIARFPSIEQGKNNIIKKTIVELGEYFEGKIKKIHYTSLGGWYRFPKKCLEVTPGYPLWSDSQLWRTSENDR
ncbi:hypothetical protein H7169_02425 [Candidatus Gracilibacteria bacterium]|nr:hypothetical protein [Candidatus Gracilibacteria bacterium]